MFKINERFQMIENRNWKKEIKLNKRDQRIKEELIHQYF